MKIFAVLFSIALFFTKVKCDDKLPAIDDLNLYIDAIGGTLYYLKSVYIDNKEDGNVIRPDNLRFAMVVTYVNLLKVERKSDKLPAHVSAKIPGMLDYLNNLTTKSAKDIISLQIANSEFISLIGLEDLWETTLPNFRDSDHYQNMLDLDEKLNETKLKQNTLNAPYYELCLDDMAKNVFSQRHQPCNLDLRCLKLLSSSPPASGYELTIWLYIFTYNWYSCQCYIFTPSRDREIAHRICSLAYREALGYQSFNLPEIIDTIMERATLCTLLGYTEFLNRRWITNALHTGTKSGCFTKLKVVRKMLHARLFKYQPKCLNNNTALAAAAVSLAIRYVLEKQTPGRAAPKLKSSVFATYVGSVENAVKYLESGSNLANSDFNVIFGTFLAYMNFKQLVAKSTIFAPDIKLWVDQMHYRLGNMTNKLMKHLPPQIVPILPLFKIEKSWIENMKDLPYLKTSYERGNVQLSNNAEVFANTVDLYCTSAMSNMLLQSEKSIVCKVPQVCLERMTKSTITGSPVKTRLMFLMFSQYARNCFLISRFRDLTLKRQWCSMAHGQLQFIIDKGIDKLGYILEMVVLCGHHGFDDFMNEKWISHILQHQGNEGCFVNKRKKSSTREDYRRKDSTSCHTKTTLFTTSLLSLAVRYIAEMYY